VKAISELTMSDNEKNYELDIITDYQKAKESMGYSASLTEAFLYYYIKI